MIRLSGVNKRYRGGPLVLRDVEMEVSADEFVAVVGRSGCGKTTLLNLIGALDTEYEGDIEISGRSLRGLDDRQLSGLRSRFFGFVFQAYHLLDHLRVIENVELPALFGVGGGLSGGAGVRRRAEEVLERIGLLDRSMALPGELSGGERQRLALARALFHRPPVLLCDEPTGNLDARTGGEVVSLIREIHRDEHHTVVVATHDESIAASADRVVELAEGALT